MTGFTGGLPPSVLVQFVFVAVKVMNSKQKGKRGELELSAFLREHGFEARRGVQYKGSAESPDVVGLPGHHVEVKRVEALQLYDALNQAQHDAGLDQIPIVCHRRNGKPHYPLPWVAILKLSDYLGMVKELESLRALSLAAIGPGLTAQIKKDARCSSE